MSNFLTYGFRTFCTCGAAFKGELVIDRDNKEQCLQYGELMIWWEARHTSEGHRITTNSALAAGARRRKEIHK